MQPAAGACCIKLQRIILSEIISGSLQLFATGTIQIFFVRLADARLWMHWRKDSRLITCLLSRPVSESESEKWDERERARFFSWESDNIYERVEASEI